jgi:hypothetical protein
MRGKKAKPPHDLRHDPLLRVQVVVPRSLCWMLAGSAIGHFNHFVTMLHEIGRFIL